MNWRVQIIFYLFSTSLVFADVTTEEIKANRDFLKNNYSNFIISSYETHLANYYYFRLIDVGAIISGLNMRSDELAVRAKDLTLQIENMQGSYEKKAVELATVRSIAQNHLSELHLIANDVQELKSYSNNIYGDAELDFSRKHFLVPSMYAPNRLELKARGSNMSAYFIIGNSPSMQGFNAVGDGYVTSREVDGIFVTTCGAVGSVIPVIGTAAGFLIGSAIVFIKDAIGYTFEIAEQRNLFDEIYSIQKNAINSLNHLASSKNQQICEKMFGLNSKNAQDSNLFSLKQSILELENNVYKNLAFVEKKVTDVNQLWDSVKELIQEDFELLVDAHYGRVCREYSSNLETQRELQKKNSELLVSKLPEFDQKIQDKMNKNILLDRVRLDFEITQWIFDREIEMDSTDSFLGVGIFNTIREIAAEGLEKI